MEAENIFERILRFLERNNLKLQDFVTYSLKYSESNKRVKFLYTDGTQSPFLLAQKTVNGLATEQFRLGIFTADELLSRDKADYFRRQYAFTFKCYDPEKVFCRFPTADEAAQIHENLEAVNQKLHLLGKPLIYGKYWLSSKAGGHFLSYDMDEGKILKAPDGEVHKVLIILQNPGER